jgi:hypothetical protein
MEKAIPTADWGQPSHPQEGKPRRIRVKLETVQDARKEMSKVYREARSGKVDISDASKLANILMLIGRMIESSDLEKRIAALEDQ